jgi:hypothetical protein
VRREEYGTLKKENEGALINYFTISLSALS